MKFQRRLQPTANADLVPMIDVVFQLVVFFMISSTLISKTGINLDLPKAQYAQESVTANLVLSVVSRDEMYLGDQALTLADLDEVLRIHGEDYADRSLVIEADETLPYGVMIAVLDVLQENGFRGANLVAERADRP